MHDASRLLKLEIYSVLAGFKHSLILLAMNNVLFRELPVALCNHLPTVRIKSVRIEQFIITSTSYVYIDIQAARLRSTIIGQYPPIFSTLPPHPLNRPGQRSEL
jgi:hypothetical protein